MEWQLVLALMLGSLILMMLTGFPIAFCFILVSVVMVLFMWGGNMGVRQLILSLFSHITSFALLPLALFILMGEALFHSGIAPEMVDAVDKWLGRLPGRLGLLSVASGTVLATLTGASAASTAILGSLLTPEMEKRGYGKAMSLGPILGSGGLAIMIPPTALGVFLAAVAFISIGKLLVAIIIPGLLMATLYAMYIILRCWMQPSVAPAYEVTLPPVSRRLIATAKYVLPAGVIIFLVTGVIILGIATPSEAAATGALGIYILAASYGRFNWKFLKKSVMGAVEITGMLFMILAGAIVYSQIVAFSGAGEGLAKLIIGLPVAPVMIVVGLQILGLFLGMFLAPTAIILILIPLFMPVVQALGFDPVWFSVIFLLNIEMATTSPPFGGGLYIMKGVAPPDTTMGDIIKAALPFLGCDLIAMTLIIAFPQLALWLPSIVR